MLVLYGKRRVGKTALIRELFKNSKTKNLYFFVPRNEKINNIINNFASIVKNELNLKEYEKIESFSDLIKILFDYSKNKKIIIAFDEFQNFVFTYPEALDILQREWDIQNNDSNLSLIISGSVMGMIKNIFIEKNSPLFKRAYNMIKLDELSMEKTFELMSLLKIKSFEDKIKLYFLFGGVIFYYSLIDYYNIKSFNDAVNSFFLSPVAPLKDSIKGDMIEAFGNKSATYFSILEAIAEGKNTNNEVATYAELKETSLSQYIYDLKSMLGIIKTITLPTKQFKPGSKKNKFIITDNFYNFWFSAINKNYSYYEINDIKGLAQKLNQIIPLLNGIAFERFAQKFIEFLSRNGIIFHINNIGNWWGKNPEKMKAMNREEIDIVAVNEKTKDILFGECKWSNSLVGVNIYNNLKAKSKLIEWNNEKRKEHFVLFSKAGFTNEMKIIATKDNVMLFNLNAVEKVFASV